MSIVDDFVEHKTIMLERLKYGVFQQIGAFTRATMKFDTRVVDPLCRSMITTLEADVLAHKVDQQQVKRHVSVPESWWQHLKQDHAPAWFLKRRPVKNERQEVVVTVKKWATFPEANFYPPDLGSPVYKVWLS